MPWDEQDFRQGLACMWVAAASKVPKEEEIAPSVVDTLFQIAFYQIAFRELLLSRLYGETWSWLTLQPSLPPVCKGRSVGSGSYVMLRVQNLKDVEILKSYLLLIWSEWDPLFDNGYIAMEISICKDFGGIKMNSHRVDLLQRLDHILKQLDMGLEHLQQHRPELDEAGLQTRKAQYEGLRDTLLKVDSEALEVLTRASRQIDCSFEPLTLVYAHRITFDIHMCTSSSMSIVNRLGCLALASGTFFRGGGSEKGECKSGTNVWSVPESPTIWASSVDNRWICVSRIMFFKWNLTGSPTAFAIYTEQQNFGCNSIRKCGSLLFSCFFMLFSPYGLIISIICHCPM